MSARQRVSRGVGRPVNADSASTLASILDAACSTFAEFGYHATSYRILQDRTGLTAPTLYHYFASKLDLYRAVFNEVHREVHDVWLRPCLGDPSDPSTTFHVQMARFLSAVQQMSRERPILARFVNGARVDVVRHSELAPLARTARRRRVALFSTMVDTGIGRGEIRAEDRAVAIDMLDAISAGLSTIAARPGHDRAAVGLSRLLTGDLVMQSTAQRG